MSVSDYALGCLIGSIATLAVERWPIETDPLVTLIDAESSEALGSLVSGDLDRARRFAREVADLVDQAPPGQRPGGEAT